MGVDISQSEGGLIENEKRDAGEATHIGSDAGETDDAAAVGEQNRIGIAAIATGLDIELPQESAGFVDPLAGLAGSGRRDDDERAGVIPSVMERLEGSNSGLAPLAGATEHKAIGGGAQNIGLDGVGLPVEASLGPKDGIGDGGRGGPRWRETGSLFAAARIPDWRPVVALTS